MEISRWPKGGLNLDDSVELMDTDDWFDASNIIDGRSYQSRNREKENVRGTIEIASSGVLADITSSDNFSGWINDATGETWTISTNSSVILPENTGSKYLRFNFPSTRVGKVQFTAAYSALGIVPDYLKFRMYGRLGTTNVFIYEENITTTSGLLNVLMNADTPIDNVCITINSTTYTFSPESGSLNQWGGGGNYESSSIGYSSTISGSVMRDATIFHAGSYSQKYIHGSSTQAIFFSCARARFTASAGKKYNVSCWIRTPSGSPIASSSSVFNIACRDESGSPSLSYSIVSEVTKTVSSATNVWQKLEAVIQCASSGDYYPFVNLVPASGVVTDPILIPSGVVYADEFYINDEIPSITRPFSLSSPLLITQTLQNITDSDSKCIGVIRSAQDDVNYLFFYNINSSKNCILKLDNSGLSLVLKWSGLQFSPLKEHRINGSVVNNLLYFTDNKNSLRCVNTSRYTSGGVPSSEEEISLIKRGPIYPPVLALNLEPPFTPKELSDELQFAYQYEYIDGQTSVLSPWSPQIKKASTTSTIVQSVTASVSAYETVPVLVKRIHFVVRIGNIGTPFRFGYKDASSALNVTYTGNKTEVVESIYQKPFELVPLIAKTLTASKSRVWIGNYLEGYDTPTDSNIQLSYAVDPEPTQVEGVTISSNSEYNMGIVFFDSNGRSSGVLDKGWRVSVGFDLLRDSTSSIYGHRKFLRVRADGTAPSWAKSYSIVITKNLAKNYFFEGIVSSYSVASTDADLYYIKKDTTTGEEVQTQTFSSNDTLYTVVDVSRQSKIGQFYSYVDGDYIYLSKHGTSTNFGPFKIIKQIGNKVYLPAFQFGATTTSDPFTSTQITYQIWRPPATDVAAVYYEIMHLPINLMNGIYYNWSGDAVNMKYPFGLSLLSEMNLKGPDINWNTDIGRPFVKTDQGQSYKKTFFKHSSPFIPGTTVNGLSEFNVGDERSVAIEAGSIQKLQPTHKESTEGDVILAVCNSDTFSIYVDESRISSGDGLSILSASPNVIGDVRKQRAGFGSLHPESIHEEDGDCYWFDKYSRSLVRYASNGVFPISEYKVVSLFEEFARLNTESDIVVSGYDPFYKLFFFTFANASSSRKKTIAFSYLKNRWISFFDFAPDAYVTGSDRMYSIVNGTIFEHTGSEFNNFYGVNYTSDISLSFNDSPDTPKEWKALQVQSQRGLVNFGGRAGTLTDGDSNTVFVDTSIADGGQGGYAALINGVQEGWLMQIKLINGVVYGVNNRNQLFKCQSPIENLGYLLSADISNFKGQNTNITTEWDEDEQLTYAEIKCDLNSDGGLLNGDLLNSTDLQVKYSFIGPEYKSIKLFKAGFEPSRGHTL